MLRKPAVKLRSLLFVPGDSERKFAKAQASGADALILDLEDSVAPRQKAEARAHVAELLDKPGPRALVVLRADQRARHAASRSTISPPS